MTVTSLSAFLALPAQAASERSSLAGDAHQEAKARDPEGLSTLSPLRRRSPSGLLYPHPPSRTAPSDGRTSLEVEAGWLLSRGDEEEARHREYLDPRDGLWLRYIALDHAIGGTTDRISGVAGSLARSDGYARLGWLRPGRFRLWTSYDSLEHTYASDARFLLTGIGGERLSLPPSLVPGNNSASELDTALASIGERRIAMSRNESEVELTTRLLPSIVLRGSYRLVRRDGERPWGGTLGLPFGSTNSGSVVETLEPIHQRTHDWSGRIEWSGEHAQANLAYEGAYFDNRRESLVWENPFAAFDLGATRIPGQPLGRMALAPDNQRHQLLADFAVRTPWRGRLTASGSWARMEQNESLLPATINSGVTDFSLLARRRADARVDVFRIQSRWQIRPLRRLTLSVGARFTRRDSDTRYLALNPTTGRYGYVVEDLGPTNRVGAVPYSHRRVGIEAGARWRLARHVSIGGEYAHERMHRSGRARRETVDDRFRLHLSARGPLRSNHRLAVEIRHRGGSAYDPTRDNAFYAPAPNSIALSGASRSLRSFRQYDLARHTSHRLDLRSSVPLAETADLTMAAGWMDRDYAAQHGLQRERSAELALDLSHRPDPRLDLHVFANLEWRDRRLATIDSQPGPASSFLPGSPAFPLPNAWSWSARSLTTLVGASSSLRLADSITLSLAYRFQTTDESTRSGFDRSGGALTSTVDPATATTSFPVIRLRDHLLETAATWPVGAPIEANLFYRLHVSDFEDAQQRGIAPRINQTLYLAHRDRDFVAHIAGVTATLRY